MSGEGALAIWNDCRTGDEEGYEYWYQTEHLPERLGVPGFRRGRRYQVIQGAPAYFTWYEVDTPNVLRSPAYEERLGNPTPMTRQVMSGIFQNASRTVCRREVLWGEIFGAVAITVRLAEQPDAGSLSELFRDPALTARAELWLSDEAPDSAPRAEEAIRGPDQKIGACVMIEYLREAPALAAADRLVEMFPSGEVGVYRLLCERRS